MSTRLKMVSGGSDLSGLLSIDRRHATSTLSHYQVAVGCCAIQMSGCRHPSGGIAMPVLPSYSPAGRAVPAVLMPSPILRIATAADSVHLSKVATESSSRQFTLAHARVLRRSQQPQPTCHNSQGQHSPTATKRQLLVVTAWLPSLLEQAAVSAATKQQVYGAAFLKAFQQALSADGSFEDRDKAWSAVIQLGPSNAAAWSNRGTLRLQYQQWAAAYEDLSQAAALEQQQLGAASAVVLNNLGNVEGALGRWEDAMQHYQQATEDDELGSIAGANYALAAWETGQDQLAVKAARSLLRRDPEFLDMRCALTAFLWGSGDRAAAEDTWEQLQQASDGLGAALYSRSSAVERVRHRWPPRATAALVAFLALSEEGQAEGYDLVMHQYTFSTPPGA